MYYETEYGHQERTLKEIKDRIEDSIRGFMAENDLELVHQVTRRGSKAVKEIDVKVFLRDH